jgi:hypothetical protein
MEIHFFWIADNVAHDMYQVAWHPDQGNLADYQSKHHIGSHHVYFFHVREGLTTQPQLAHHAPAN